MNPTVAQPGGAIAAERFAVTGLVQGVGFRPFVHRLAMELGLVGHVGNDSTKVFIEVAGPSEELDRFARRLVAEAPSLAHIVEVVREPAGEVSEAALVRGGFHIVESRVRSGGRTLVSPDVAVCADCTREMFDPADRRFGHPFITCTNCGPRFTIIESLPYDRPNTTMAGFTMCEACEAEYCDPHDRRHHAQPIGCLDCGPTLELRTRATGELSPADGARSRSRSNAVFEAARLLTSGAVVAIKGIGGYHLACDATSDEAVGSLRSRKHRPDKPLAVMVADLGRARDVAEISTAEADLLSAPEAPIVLLRARGESSLSSLVAPGNPLIGLMLPYTPVHHLLFDAGCGPLVMTSANRSGDPIAHRTESIDGLADLFDAVLDHDRAIHVPCDDSVVRVVGERLLPVRRARGYAPIPVPLPGTGGALLAVGADVKNTFCLAADGWAWVSQHLGDMENLATVQAFDVMVDRFTDMYGVAPSLVVADAHPGYRSSKWAHANHAGRVLEVQHHHAHVAAVMAEHQRDPAERVIGFAFDGTGYGLDGTIWGGEMFSGSVDGFERVGHLEEVLLPGGDAAIRNPCRVALAHLYAAGVEWAEDLAPVAALDAAERSMLGRQIDRGFSCVPCTSMGRLFDAVASLVGYRQHITYEAQAAIDLEVGAVRVGPQATGYRFDLADGVISPGPVLRAIVGDLATGLDPDVISWRFHDAVAEAVHALSCEQRAGNGISTVVLSGGVFQNALLVQLCLDRLAASGFTTLTHQLVPPNDGGLALGQAYIAAHRTATLVLDHRSEES